MSKHKKKHRSSSSHSNKNEAILDEVIPEAVIPEEVISEEVISEEVIAAETGADEVSPNEYLLNPEFTGEDFTNSLQDPYYRFAKNSRNIGHALILKSESGELVAMQYKLPCDENSQTNPTICELSNIELIRPYNMTRFRAIGPDGKVFYAKRYNHAHLTDEFDETKSIDFAYFSEEETPGKEPFWGSSDKPVPRFNMDLEPGLKKDFETELKENSLVTKGGYDLEVESESVNYRNENPRRKPNQNTVMGESARDHYEYIYDNYKEVMSFELKKVFKRAFLADIRKVPENQFRPEWLHAYGHGLTPLSQNPQLKSNLGAGGKWVNTEMMVLERIAKWFSMHQNDADRTTIRLNSFLSMLLDSEVIDWLRFVVEFEKTKTDGQIRILKFIQELDPFKTYPVFRKSSDLAQANAITYAILNDIQPYKIEKVLRGSQASSSCSQSTFSAPALEDSNKNIRINFDDKAVSSNSVREGELPMPKQHMSRHLRYAQSIVKIETAFHEHNYHEPWVGPGVKNSTGSGFVIEHNNEKFIVTNAHVVANQVTTEVILASHQQEKFYAKPICVSYQSDLALLRVKKSKFQELAKPVEFGEMAKIDDKVTTVGFPMGGEDICFTQGPISRIESGTYSVSGCRMLHLQTQSPINPGNSGGPVFYKDRVIGVAFQKMHDADSVGYVIPAPIVLHFLQETFSGKEYRGFPVLPLEIQSLDNPYQRRLFYGMHDGLSGVLINKLDHLSEIGSKLKPQDIILEIDGHKISNDGKVKVGGIDNDLDFNHITHMKYVGDSVRLKVLRKNHMLNKSEILNITINLEYTPGETKLVGTIEHDKRPSYYINSGVVFTPLTINYINDLLEREEFNQPMLAALSYYKKYPDQQLIVLNTILNCKYTKGYAQYTNEIINKVNNVEVRNLEQLINVIESNHAPFHQIETTNNKMIVLKKMSDVSFQKLMDKYHIIFDRSKDLDHAGIQQSVRNISISSESNSELSNQHRRSEPAPLSQEHSFENMRMPGQRHFMELVANMEHLIPLESEEDILDFDRLTEIDEQENDEQELSPPRLRKFKNDNEEKEEKINAFSKKPKKNIGSGNTLFERKRNKSTDLRSAKMNKKHRYEGESEESKMVISK